MKIGFSCTKAAAFFGGKAATHLLAGDPRGCRAGDRASQGSKPIEMRNVPGNYAIVTLSDLVCRLHPLYLCCYTILVERLCRTESIGCLRLEARVLLPTGNSNS